MFILQTEEQNEDIFPAAEAPIKIIVLSLQSNRKLWGIQLIYVFNTCNYWLNSGFQGTGMFTDEPQHENHHPDTAYVGPPCTI